MIQFCYWRHIPICKTRKWNLELCRISFRQLHVWPWRHFGGIVKGSEYLRFCPNDGNFSVSVKNCNITITNLDLITRFRPFSGWINYSVNGVGNQSLNLHYILSDGSCIGPDLWTMYIDGTSRSQNEGWSISWSPEQIIKISGATKNVSIYFDSTPAPKDDLRSDPISGFF